MRVLLLSNLFPPDFGGGQELNAWKVANGLIGRGHTVVVATAGFRPGYDGPTAEPPWVRRVFEYRDPPSVLRVPGYAMRLELAAKVYRHEAVARINVPALQRLLADEEPFDIAYGFGVHNIGVSVAHPIARAGLPILWHVGDHHHADHRAFYTHSRLIGLTYRWALRRWHRMELATDYRYMAFVSRYLQGYFEEQGFPLQHSWVLPRGVDFEIPDEPPVSADAVPIFLIACRVTRDKGVHVAIEAARLLHELDPEAAWRLEIAGDVVSDYGAQLKRQIEEGGLGSRVSLIGKHPREAVLERMRSAAAFLCTSIWGEPFSNTVIEALGVGTPLIGSLTDSYLEVVQPELHGLGYPKDRPDELAACMRRILQDPGLGRRLAANGLALARDHYSMPHILDQTERLLAQVVDLHARDRSTALAGRVRG